MVVSAFKIWALLLLVVCLCYFVVNGGAGLLKLWRQDLLSCQRISEVTANLSNLIGEAKSAYVVFPENVFISKISLHAQALSTTYPIGIFSQEKISRYSNNQKSIVSRHVDRTRCIFCRCLMVFRGFGKHDVQRQRLRINSSLGGILKQAADCNGGSFAAISERDLDWQIPVRRLISTTQNLLRFRLIDFRNHPRSVRCDDMIRLSPEYAESAKSNQNEQNISSPEPFIVPRPRFRHGSNFGDTYGGLIIVFASFFGCGLIIPTTGLLWRNSHSCLGWILAVICSLILFFGIGSAFIGCLPGSWHRCLCDGEEHSENRQTLPHNPVIVLQKYIDNI